MIIHQPISKKYPYCFAYTDVLCDFTSKLEKWCKDQNIKAKFHFIGDDPWGGENDDTISFSKKQDAVLFRLTWC